MTRDATGAIKPTLAAEDLLRAVPGIDNVATISARSLMGIPGASLTLDNLLELVGVIDKALAEGTDGVVVIQGTDTIEETAFVLDLLVKGDAPVVVTGAMRGAEAAGADGPANVLSAVTVASDPASRGMGTIVILNDEIHAARFVQKSHTALPSAFLSPMAGPIGLVIEGRARFNVRVHRKQTLDWSRTGPDRPVALALMALGDDGRMLGSLASLGYQGAVLVAMGAGHVPAIVMDRIRKLAGEMPVVLATRVQTGPIFARTYGFPGSEKDLLANGVMSAGPLSALKARLLLTLILRQETDKSAIDAAFQSYLAS